MRWEKGTIGEEHGQLNPRGSALASEQSGFLSMHGLSFAFAVALGVRTGLLHMEAHDVLTN